MKTAILWISLVALVTFAGLPLRAADEPQTADDQVEQPHKLDQQAAELVSAISAGHEEIDNLAEEIASAVGEDQRALQRRLVQRQLKLVSDLGELCHNIVAQEEEGLDTSNYRALAEKDLLQLGPKIQNYIDSLEQTIDEEALGREELAAEEIRDLEEQLEKDNAHLDEIYLALLNHAGFMEIMGLDVSREKAFLHENLGTRAETLAGRVQLAVERRMALAKRASEEPDNADVKVELLAIEGKLDADADSLSATVRIMDELGLETEEYRRLLYRATGDITTEIFDRKVIRGLLQQTFDDLKSWFSENGPNFAFKTSIFLLVMFFFWILASITDRIVKRAVGASTLNLSHLLQEMIISIASRLVLFLGLLMALSQVGVSLAPLLAGLGVAGFIIGFALQDTLGNFASGVMILMYRPYDIGDKVEVAGVFGEVHTMNLVSTTIHTIDNQTLIIPNNKIWGDVIKNVTAQSERRVDMTFSISYGDDVPHAERVLWAILDEHEKVLSKPEPKVKLHTLGDYSVDFVVRPWVRTDDYWDVYWDITREVKMRFERESISIPYPQRDVHLNPRGEKD
jgi:small conductance mechanosensitive channel